MKVRKRKTTKKIVWKRYRFFSDDSFMIFGFGFGLLPSLGRWEAVIFGLLDPQFWQMGCCYIWSLLDPQFRQMGCCYIWSLLDPQFRQMGCCDFGMIRTGGLSWTLEPAEFCNFGQLTVRL